MNRTQTHHFQISHQRKRNSIRIKSVENTEKMTHQTHNRATILIRRTKVIIDAKNVRGRAIKESIRSNYAHV